MDVGAWVEGHKVEAAAGAGVVLAVAFAALMKARGNAGGKVATPSQYLIPNTLLSGQGGELLSVTGPNLNPLAGSIVNTPVPPTPVAADPPPVSVPVPVQQTQPGPSLAAYAAMQDPLGGLGMSVAPGQLNDYTHWTSGFTGLPITVDSAGVYHS